MDDFISRQAAIDEFWKSEIEFRPSQIDEIIRILRNAPTIDAVPVIRCKDCAYFSSSWGETYCTISHTNTDEDWYCADGERKDDE